MPVSSSGTPVLVASVTATNSPSATGTFPTGASPLAHHLIVVVIGLFGTTAATSVTPPAGYNVAVTTTAVTNLVAIYTKTATGSDAAPTFTGTVTGTAADASLTITIYDLADSTGGDTPLLDTSGTATIGTTALNGSTTSGNVALAGSLGITAAVIANGTTAAVNTWGTPASYTLNAGAVQSASARLQTASYFTTTGSVLVPGSPATATITKTRTTAHTAALIAVFKPQITSGAVLSPFSQPAGIRSSWVRAGMALASAIPIAVAAPPVSGPALTPLDGPVKARLAPAHQRGHIISGKGAFAGTGPAVTALDGPVQARHPLPRRGRVLSGPGKFSGTGPPVTALDGPVRSRIPARHHGGQVLEGNPGAFAGHGPAVLPLLRPVRAQAKLPPRGRVVTTPQVVVTAAAATGPPLTALHSPVTARRVPFSKGRAETGRGAFAGTGPALTALQKPVTSRRPPFAKGRVTGISAGTFTSTAATSGPPLTPLRSPVRARPPLGPHGRAMAMGPLSVTLATFTPAPPQPQPIRGRPARFSKGRAASGKGTFAGHGSALTPLHSPVKGKPARFAKGRAYGISAGTFTSTVVTTGPPLVPLHKPIAAASRQGPFRPGRAYAIYGIPVQAQPATAGPPLTPLHAPVKGRPDRFSKGRSRASTGTFTPVIITSGPPLVPLHSPVKGKPGRFSKGRSASNPGTPPPTVPFALSQPIGVRVVLVVAGRVVGASQGTFTFIAPTSGPPLTALHGPVRGKPDRFSKGRSRSGAGTFTFVAPTSGPKLTPLHGPVRPHLRAPYVHGTARAMGPLAVSFAVRTGPALFPLRGPVSARRPLPPRGRILLTPAYVPPVPVVITRVLNFLYGVPQARWVVAPPVSAWEPGAPEPKWNPAGLTTAWEPGVPMSTWEEG